jgi:hypothetical protein
MLITRPSTRRPPLSRFGGPRSSFSAQRLRLLSNASLLRPLPGRATVDDSNQSALIRGGVLGAAVLLLVACTGEQSVLDPYGPVAETIAGTWWVMLCRCG